jgi:hypothetical protein
MYTLMTKKPPWCSDLLSVQPVGFYSLNPACLIRFPSPPIRAARNITCAATIVIGPRTHNRPF